MKKFVLSIATVAMALFVNAQTLQYSGALIVSSSEATVPANKVWKVTSLYGTDRICVPCQYPAHLNHSYCSGKYIDYVGSTFYVNGNEVVASRDWTPNILTSEQIYLDDACVSPGSSLSLANYTGYALFDIETSPLLLPMWLAAGTTLKTPTSNIYLSVLEFSIIP